LCGDCKFEQVIEVDGQQARSVCGGVREGAVKAAGCHALEEPQHVEVRVRGSGEFVHRGLEPEAAARLDGVGDGLAPCGVDDEILGDAVDELGGGRAACGAGDPGACENSGRRGVQPPQLAAGDGDVGVVRVRAAIRVTVHERVSPRVVGVPPWGTGDAVRVAVRGRWR
jgi:hypothetical protein